MVRHSVSSSNLSTVGYDAQNCTLEVEFKGGNVYQYYDVPENIYLNLIRAAPIGGYLNTFIKNVYQYKQVK